MPSLPPQTPLTILLVDANEFNREGVRLYLTKNNFKIVEAGDEAIA